MRSTRRATAVSMVLAVGLVLAGCSAETAGEPTRPAPAGNLSEALAVVPMSAGSAMVVDQAAMKQRWGLADLTGADLGSDQFDEYLHRLMTYLTVGDLALYAMDDGLKARGWNLADVEWSVSIQPAGEAPTTVYQFRDTLDMTAVTGYLDDAGYTRSGPDTRPVYAVDLKNLDRRPIFLAGAVVLPERHMVVAGRNPEAVLEVIDGRQAGFGTTPTGQAMLAATPGAEGLVLGWGADACIDPIAARVSPTASASMSNELSGLGSITWWVSGIDDETHATAAAGYPDPAAATADLPRRTELVRDGDSLVTAAPYRDLLGPTTVTAADAALLYRMDAIERASRLVGMWAQRDVPWALCGG